MDLNTGSPFFVAGLKFHVFGPFFRATVLLEIDLLLLLSSLSQEFADANTDHLVESPCQFPASESSAGSALDMALCRPD